MSRKHRFNAVIENAGGGGAFVTVPFDVEQVFGKKRVKVKAVIGGMPYRGTLVRMGGPCHMLPVLKSIREKAGRNFGDEIDVVLEEDTELRAITPPDDLARALAQQPDAAAFFGKLSYTHQREYVKWIEEAKRETTRTTRIERTIAMLLEGKRGR
jgi:hypothetical protein